MDTNRKCGHQQKLWTLTETTTLTEITVTILGPEILVIFNININ